MPKKPKIAPEEKVAIVRRCLKGELGVCEAGRVVGADESTVREWIARYEVEGIEAFMPHEQNRVYSPEEKIRAVQDYLAGKGSYSEIAKNTNYV